MTLPPTSRAKETAMANPRNTTVVTGVYRRPNHGFHLLMTFLTAGLWLIVWLPLTRRRRRVAYRSHVTTYTTYRN